MQQNSTLQNEVFETSVPENSFVGFRTIIVVHCSRDSFLRPNFFANTYKKTFYQNFHLSSATNLLNFTREEKSSKISKKMFFPHMLKILKNATKEKQRRVNPFKFIVIAFLKNKRVMGASIVKIVGLMLPKHEKATLLPLLWHASRSCFCAISLKRIY